MRGFNLHRAFDKITGVVKHSGKRGVVVSWESASTYEHPTVGQNGIIGGTTRTGF